jgi:lipoprotein-releasing system permease protein
MYFNWLALLDANVVVILIIMSLVSGFTLISCVFILILQRVRMIGVLKSLGATNRQIRRVFILLGLRVVGLGLVIGNCVGIALLSLQAYFHLLPLDPESYYLTYVPVLLDWRHVLLLNGCAVLLAGMLLLIPASLVSRISPAKTMHYE